jgi:hypothetical protein
MRRGIGLAGAAVACALLGGVAGAAGTTSYPDAAGDAPARFDITRVDVSEEGGAVRVWAAIRKKDGCSIEGNGYWVNVAFDVDQNPDTGSAFYGTEVELASNEWGDFRFLRSRGWDFRGVAYAGGYSLGCGPDGMGYSIPIENLGLAPGRGFNVVVSTEGPRPDTAPDLRTFNYQPVPGTPPPALGPDTRPPHVVAYGARAVHGRVAALRYWVLDGRGKTAETIRIHRDWRLLKTIRRPLRDSNPFRLSKVAWRVPRHARGRLRFTVRAVDAAGNTSALGSAPLVVP